MNRVLSLVTGIFAASMLSCSSCGKSIDVSAQDSFIEASINHIVKDNIEFTLPQVWIEKQGEHDNVKLLAIESLNEGLILVTKEQYTETFDQFVIETLRSLRGDGIEITGTSSVIINDTTYVFAGAAKDDIRMMVWMTVKSGYGYGFMCGGPDKKFFNLNCQEIASTLKINGQNIIN